MLKKPANGCFLQPGFFEYGVSPLFSTANRKYDIYFSHPWSEDDDIEIILPKDYVLDNADAPAAGCRPEQDQFAENQYGYRKRNRHR